MLFDERLKDRTRFIRLHVELIMWGDDFIDIGIEEPEKPTVSWFSVCDGGSVESRGEKDISREKFEKAIDYIYSVDFPVQEDDETSLSWELQCLDENGDSLTGLEFGNWDRVVLNDIISKATKNNK